MSTTFLKIFEKYLINIRKRLSYIVNILTIYTRKTTAKMPGNPVITGLSGVSGLPENSSLFGLFLLFYRLGLKEIF